MSSLQTTQQQLMQAVMAEKNSRPPNIRSDKIANAKSRLAIYRHGYRIRLRDALKNEFAGLQCMAGRRFDALLDHYIEAHPSEHYNIRWYGAGLAASLDYAQPWRDMPQLGDMARLDWAVSTAFDAADEPSLDATELSTVPPASWADLRLLLQDNLQVLASTHNIEAFRRAADHATTRPRLLHFAAQRQLLVWRNAMTVHYRRLDRDEWLVLDGAMRGASFASLCEKLTTYHDESAAMPRMVALLQTWLAAGLIRGLALN